MERTDLPYFSEEEFATARNFANQAYEKSGEAYDAFFSIRRKLEYWCNNYLYNPISDHFLRVVRIERLNKQGGRGRGPNFKDYILVGLAPIDAQMGKTLFIKLSFKDIHNKPHLWIHIDVDRYSKNHKAPSELKKLASSDQIQKYSTKIALNEIFSFSDYDSLTNRVSETLEANIYAYQVVFKQYKDLKREIRDEDVEEKELEESSGFTHTEDSRKEQGDEELLGLSPGYVSPEIPTNRPSDYEYQPFEKIFGAWVAHKDTKPPLAIGLFGAWGSGKSHFMQATRWQIEDLAIAQKDYPPKDADFCQRVVHIPFNAWQYSDTNLWASFASHIFEHIHLYYEDRKTVIDADSATVLANKLQLLNQEDNRLKRELELAEKEKKDLENQKPTEVTNEQLVSKALEKRFFNLLDNTGAFKSYEWFKGILSTKVGLFSLALVILASLGGLLVGIIEPIFDHPWLTGIIGTLSPLAIAGWQILKQGLQKMHSLENALAAQVKELEQIGQDEQEKYNLRLANAKAKEESIRKEQEALQEDMKTLQISGRIKRLVEGIIEKGTYSKHLGIVNTLHRDLRTLTELLSTEPTDNKDYKIDRIVLYIDDLDRCHYTKVMEVLEAVHLLLSLPLFIVIVGVDPRWVHHALRKRYEHLEVQELFHNNGLLSRQASTREFLEKIFQINYTLTSWDTDRRKKFVQTLLRNNAERENGKLKSKSVYHPTIVAQKKKALEEEVNKSGEGNESVEEAKKQIADLHIQQDEYLRDVVHVLSKELTLEEEERKFLADLTTLFGHTPRSIHRYLNLYRLLKAEQIEQGRTHSLDKLKSMALVLAIALDPEGESLFDTLDDALGTTLGNIDDEEGRTVKDWFTNRDFILKNWSKIPLIDLKGESEFRKAVKPFVHVLLQPESNN